MQALHVVRYTELTSSRSAGLSLSQITVHSSCLTTRRCCAVQGPGAEGSIVAGALLLHVQTPNLAWAQKHDANTLVHCRRPAAALGAPPAQWWM